MNTAANESKRTARVDLKVLAAISAFASKDEVRYYLNGVCVELGPKSTTYVATDGVRLLAYQDDQFGGDAVNTLQGTFIIPTPQCKAHKFKKDFALATLEQDDGSEFLTIEFGDVGVTFKPIDGSFPSWRRVVPQGRASGVPGQFNPELLATFGKFGKALEYGLPSVDHNGAEQAARVFFSVDHVIGVIMPFRAPDAHAMAPDWVGAAAWDDADPETDEIFNGPLQNAVEP